MATNVICRIDGALSLYIFFCSTVSSLSFLILVKYRVQNLGLNKADESHAPSSCSEEVHNISSPLSVMQYDYWQKVGKHVGDSSTA